MSEHLEGGLVPAAPGWREVIFLDDPESESGLVREETPVVAWHVIRERTGHGPLVGTPVAMNAAAVRIDVLSYLVGPDDKHYDEAGYMIPFDFDDSAEKQALRYFRDKRKKAAEGEPPTAS